MNSTHEQAPLHRGLIAAFALPVVFALLAGALVSVGPISAATPGTFSPTGDMNTARSYHTATKLTSGKVLVAGGSDASDVPVDSADLYDPPVTPTPPPTPDPTLTVKARAKAKKPKRSKAKTKTKTKKKKSRSRKR